MRDNAPIIPPLQGLQYGLLGLPLAFVALPVYVHLPNFYAQTFGMSLGILGAILLLTRCFDGLIDPWLGRRMDAVYQHSRRHVIWVALGLALLLAIGFAALFLPPAALTSDTAAARVAHWRTADQPLGLQRAGHFASSLGGPPGWGRGRTKPVGHLARGSGFARCAAGQHIAHPHGMG